MKKKMKKSTLVLLIVIAATLLLCAAIIAISVAMHGKPEPADPTGTSATSNFFDIETTTPTEPTISAEEQLQKDLLGKWMDSANMSGFEFFADGKVTVTYVNLTIPFLNLPINGTANGTYTLNGETLTTKYSIYTKTISKQYFVSVKDNELTMRSLEDGDVSTYQRTNEIPVYDTPQADNDLAGAWVNSDGSIRYSFADEGTVTVTYAGARIDEVSKKPLNGSYTGIYMTTDDSLTIQFVMDSVRVTQKFTYQVSARALSLTDEKNNTLLFVRDGTGTISYATEADLLGTWKDSTGSNGYTFLDGGLVDLTYVNFTIPVLNMPITGKYRGTFEVSGSKLTLRYSIYGRSFTETYTFAINGSTLTLTDTETGKVSSYMK